MPGKKHGPAVKKQAPAGARSKRTLANLPRSTRTALAGQANKVKRSG